mmetsp:Transcript_53917/g.127406  ORF Transcript_53917/g.127406 Transcript_53917/m.127406 type:complete len:289 (-) Transcript_53917:56-922(-)
MNPDGTKKNMAAGLPDMGDLSLGMEPESLEAGAPSSDALAGMMPRDEQEKSTAKKSVSMAGDEFDALNSVGRCPLRSASSPSHHRFGRNTTLSAQGQEVGPELSLDTVQVDSPGDMKMKMDLLGKGSDGAKSQLGGKAHGGADGSGEVGSRRRSRSTLPANFRLSIDPSGLNPPNVVLAGAPAPAAGAAAAGATIPGAGVQVRQAVGRSGMTAKELIADEEEQMALSMSLYGNPFGPRVGNSQILNTFSWLADTPGIPEGSELKMSDSQPSPAAAAVGGEPGGTAAGS